MDPTSIDIRMHHLGTKERNKEIPSRTKINGALHVRNHQNGAQKLRMDYTENQSNRPNPPNQVSKVATGRTNSEKNNVVSKRYQQTKKTSKFKIIL